MQKGEAYGGDGGGTRGLSARSTEANLAMAQTLSVALTLAPFEGNPNMSLSDNDKKRAIFLEQLKRGVMKESHVHVHGHECSSMSPVHYFVVLKAYMEQLIAERRKQEEALEAKKAQKMLEDQQEKERVEKARSRGYLA